MRRAFERVGRLLPRNMFLTLLMLNKYVGALQFLPFRGALRTLRPVPTGFAAPAAAQASSASRDDVVLTSARERRRAQTVIHRAAAAAARQLADDGEAHAHFTMIKLADFPAAFQNNVLKLPGKVRRIVETSPRLRFLAGRAATDPRLRRRFAAAKSGAPIICMEGDSVLALYQ